MKVLLIYIVLTGAGNSFTTSTGVIETASVEQCLTVDKELREVYVKQGGARVQSRCVPLPQVVGS